MGKRPAERPGKQATKYPPKAMPCCVTASVVALSRAALQASWRASALREALARAGKAENASGHVHCRLHRPGRERIVEACIPALLEQTKHCTYLIKQPESVCYLVYQYCSQAREPRRAQASPSTVQQELRLRGPLASENELGRQNIMQARMQALGARGALVCMPEQCRAWSRQLLHAQQWQRRVHSSAGCEVRACKWILRVLFVSFAAQWCLCGLKPDQHCVCCRALHILMCKTGRHAHTLALPAVGCRKQCFSTHCVPLHLQTSGAHLSMGETTEHAATALQERQSSSDGANSSAAAQEPCTAVARLVCARSRQSQQASVCSRNAALGPTTSQVGGRRSVADVPPFAALGMSS